jgi:hypothetical protein
MQTVSGMDMAEEAVEQTGPGSVMLEICAEIFVYKNHEKNPVFTGRIPGYAGMKQVFDISDTLFDISYTCKI